jgi:ribosomal protein S1
MSIIINWHNKEKRRLHRKVEFDQKKPTCIEDLRPGMKLRGEVKKVELCGAFVDIGVGCDGLLHISQLSWEPISKVTEVVNEGDKVTVWVKDVDLRKRHINLTMLRPPRRAWRELKPGRIVDGKVTKIAPFGAFVDIGVGCDGLVHVSELAPGYVPDPADMVSVGEEVEVRILSVDRRRRRIALSMKDLPLEIDVKYESLPTVMEVALRKAMAERSRERRKRRKKKATRRREQEEMIAETLRRLRK